MKYWLGNFFIYFFAVCVGCFPYTCLANKPCDLTLEVPPPGFGSSPVPTYYFKEKKVDSDCDVNINGRLWIREEQDISINSIQAESLENRGKLRANKINVYNKMVVGASTWTCIQNDGEIETETIAAECSSGSKEKPTPWAINNTGTIKAKKVFGKSDINGIGANSISMRMRELIKAGRTREITFGIYELDREAVRKAQKKWGSKRNVQEDIANGEGGIYEVDWMMGVGEKFGGVVIFGGHIKAKTLIGISKEGEGIENMRGYGGTIEAEKVESLTQPWYPDQDGNRIPIVPRGKNKSYSVDQKRK